MTESTKVVDDIYMVPWNEGNGQIRREVWLGEEGRVARYSLFYVNPDVLSADKGRVLGYEFQQGSILQHRMEKTTPLEFSTLEELEERFAVEWDLLPKQNEPILSASAGEGGGGGDAYSETMGMRLTITKGSAEDFFARGREIAGRLDRGERVEPEKVVIFGDRHDLCYSQMPKR